MKILRNLMFYSLLLVALSWGIDMAKPHIKSIDEFVAYEQGLLDGADTKGFK